MNTQHFLQELERLSESIDLEELRSLLGELEIEEEFLRRYVQFDSDTYRRNLLHRCKKFEVLVLCFEAGQRTPIHDHAGSACGVKVIEGTGTETVFEQTADGWLYATGSHELPQGGVVGSNDMDIHQLSNLQTGGRPLVTLHVYSPPLGEVGNYSIEDNSVRKVTAATRELTTRENSLA